MTQRKKMHIKKGDTVKVIAGESKGSEGRVLNIDRKAQRAFVEGVNMVSKNQRPTSENPQGGINKQEGSIHVSNLLPVDPESGEATRVGRQKNKDGKSVRIAKRSGQEIK